MKLPFEVKTISDDKLLQCMRSLRPVFRHQDQNLHFLKFTNTLEFARRSSYIWICKSDGKVRTEVQPRSSFRAYSRYGYVGFFKPSLAEVFAYLPEDALSTSNAFEIVDSPEDARDLNLEHEIVNAGYHVFTVALYWITPEVVDDTILGRDFLTV